MSKQKKQGFTLIELMVVIVIIGILAAIAIPKLFGMSAKAKASEVGPAAGTWSKLQQAYIMEKSSVGKPTEISYKLPGATGTETISKTANFEYYATADSDSIGENGAKADWFATAVTGALGDCKRDVGIWLATYTLTTSGEGVSAGVPTNDDCKSLTPNFTKLQ